MWPTDEIESDNLILRDAAEMPVRSKAQAAGLAEFGELVWREDADEAAVQGIVFSNRRNGVRHAEWTLAGNHNVAVGRDRKIERAEFRIRHQPGRLDRSRGSERDDGVVALAIRADAGAQGTACRHDRRQIRGEMALSRTGGYTRRARQARLKKP